MRAEIIPYAAIVRITVSAARESNGQLGFDVDRAPVITIPSGEEAHSAEHAFHACDHAG